MQDKETREAFEKERALVFDLKRGTARPDSYADPKLAAEWRVFQEAYSAAVAAILTVIKEDSSIMIMAQAMADGKHAGFKESDTLLTMYARCAAQSLVAHLAKYGDENPT